MRYPNIRVALNSRQNWRRNLNSCFAALEAFLISLGRRDGGVKYYAVLLGKKSGIRFWGEKLASHFRVSWKFTKTGTRRWRLVFYRDNKDSYLLKRHLQYFTRCPLYLKPYCAPTEGVPTIKLCQILLRA